jgi:hypothetical protein
MLTRSRSRKARSDVPPTQASALEFSPFVRGQLQAFPAWLAAFVAWQETQPRPREMPPTRLGQPTAAFVARVNVLASLLPADGADKVSFCMWARQFPDTDADVWTHIEASLTRMYDVDAEAAVVQGAGERGRRNKGKKRLAAAAAPTGFFAAMGGAPPGYEAFQDKMVDTRPDGDDDGVETACSRAQRCGLDRYTFHVRYDPGVKHLLFLGGGHANAPTKDGLWRVFYEVARDKHGRKNATPIGTLLQKLFGDQPGVHVVKIEADSAFGAHDIVF